MRYEIEWFTNTLLNGILKNLANLSISPRGSSIVLACIETLPSRMLRKYFVDPLLRAHKMSIITHEGAHGRYVVSRLVARMRKDL